MIRVPCAFNTSTEDACAATSSCPRGFGRSRGNFDADAGRLTFEAPFGDGSVARFDLALEEGRLRGQGSDGTWEIGLRLAYVGPEHLERSYARRVVDLSKAERPESFEVGSASTPTCAWSWTT